MKKRDMFWYERPAEKWIEALPLGNGRLGAMVYGRTREERIQIDETSFWSGKPSEDNNRPETGELLWKIRRFLQEGNYEEADRLGHDFVGNKNQYGTSMPVGELILSVEGLPEGAAEKDGEIRNYRRSLLLDEGIAATVFTLNGVSFEREMFLSNPAQAAVLRIRTDRPVDLSFRYEGIENNTSIVGEIPCVEEKRPGPDMQAGPEEKGPEEECAGKRRPGRQICCRIAGDAHETLHSDGTCGAHLEGQLLIEHDGEGSCENHRGLIRGCREVVCYLDLETDMLVREPEKLAGERVQLACKKGWERLKEEHIRDVKPLYDRMDLSLGDEERQEVPTEERIAQMAAGERDNDLCRLMFQYGRYLLIASSREDSPLPTHMGGIWNDNIYNKIDCAQDMHIDMNLEMQYWASAQCGLPECYEPFFRYLETVLVPSGTKTARQVYGADGWTAHVVTNPWGFTSLGWCYNWGVFSLGGAWCACLAWDYYTYTADLEWLKKRGFELIRGAAAFAADYVFYDEKTGFFMTGPSYSPENMFRTNGKDYFLSLSDTCDVLLVREILTVYRKAACELEKEADPLCERAAHILDHLPPYRTGKEGQLQEWFEDFDEPIPNHRHTSHLLGLYPFRQIVPQRDEKLADAAGISIDRRRRDFEITSWGMNMLTGYYARLGMPGQAMEVIQETFARLVKPNMASVMSDESSMWGGEWELDGNTGLTSAMAEMLVQSFEGEVILLPALPDAWKDGSLQGIGIRGGHHMNLIWMDGRPVRVELLAGRKERLTVRFRETQCTVECRPGETAVLEQF